MAVDSTLRSILPVFVQQRNLPGDIETDKYTVHEICQACEKKSGHGTVLGAQRLGSLWRIYPKSIEARTKLLLSGVGLRGHTITLCDKNPFIVNTKDGEREIKTTKLVVGNLPISFSNKEIEDMIIKLGGKPQSALFMERDRDDRGGLTRWLTGRRFMYIQVPERPLPPRVELGPFKATLFHFEQKAARQLQCGRCLQPGHASAGCENDVICLECRKPGHKRGSPLCQQLDSMTEKDNTNEVQQPQDDGAGEESTLVSVGGTTVTANNQSSAEKALPAPATATPSTPRPRESRPRVPHSTLPFGRTRSFTPTKRSRESPTSEQSQGKFTRREAKTAPSTDCRARESSASEEEQNCDPVNRSDSTHTTADGWG